VIISGLQWHQLASTLGPERPVFGVVCTTLHQGRLPRPFGGHAQLTGQLAASTRRWPYPTHCVTGTRATRHFFADRAPGQAASELPHCGQATPSNRRMRPGNFRMRLAHTLLHHSTGRNKRSFSGPHKLYRVDCLTQQRQIPQVKDFRCVHMTWSQVLQRNDTCIGRASSGDWENYCMVGKCVWATDVFWITFKIC
jgi:hypothetical protein